jgi:hypothetical protein
MGRKMPMIYRRALMGCYVLLVPPTLRPRRLKMVLDGGNLLFGSGIQAWTMALTTWTWEDKTDVP